MNTSRCHRCNEEFAYESCASTSGYYMVSCSNRHRLLRCAHTSCTYLVDATREDNMRRHQLQVHANDTNELETAAVEFDVGSDVNYNDDDHDNMNNVAAEITPNIGIGTIYSIPNEIINDRPHISLLFQTDDNDESELDRDEQVMEELVNLDVQEEQEEIPTPSLHDFQENDTNNTKMTLSQLAEVMKGIKNQVFFCQQHNIKNGGIRGIIQRADKPRRVPDLNSFASEEATRAMFGILDNLIGQTESEREKYLLSLDSLFQISNGLKEGVNIEIPFDLKSANRLCLRSVHSSFANIPYEEPFIIDGHVCISASDKLNTILAKGTNLSYWQDQRGRTNFEGFNGTPIGRQLFDRAKVRLVNGNKEDTCFGYIMTWSDGYQPNFSRKRDSTIWLYVMRVCAPPGHSTSEDHTFCLAFGSGSRSHDKVVEYYHKEMEGFVDGIRRYDGNIRAIVNTSFTHAHPCNTEAE